MILSSSRHPDDINRSYQMRANAYIVKPTGFDGFGDMIKGGRYRARFRREHS